MKRAVLILLCIFLCGTAWAGSFTDRGGVMHSWSVDSSNVLIWDGSPYVPFGVDFSPRGLVSGSEADWAADERGLAALKAAGVTDVLLKASDGITAYSVEDIQRAVDMLESSGFSYGVSLFCPPYARLAGYSVRPTENRVEDVKSPGLYPVGTAEADSALFVLCSKTGEVREKGNVNAVGGGVSFQVSRRYDEGQILLFYPHKSLDVSSAGMPDMWADYDARRDRLVAFLSKIEFGGGLRFFVDPFTESLGWRGGSDGFFPDSNAFRIEYAAWLSLNYRSVRDLTVAWNVLPRDLRSFEEAAGMVPLWWDGRGVPMLYDAQTDEFLAVDAVKSSVWEDFLAFRSYSAGMYLNSMADVLKRFAAEVPVVYSAGELAPELQPPDGPGFDGLAAVGSGGDDVLAVRAGTVLSLAESSGVSSWILACPDSPAGGFAAKSDMFGRLNLCRDMGAKGFFVGGVSASGGADWLGEYAALSRNDKFFVSSVSRAVFYPETVAGLSPRKLAGGVWWLPSLDLGAELEVGEGFGAYSIIRPDRPQEIYMWSRGEERIVHLVSSAAVYVVDVDGEEAKCDPRKGRVEFVLGDEPVLVRGIGPENVLPVEAAEDSIVEFEAAIERYRKAGVDVGGYEKRLEVARDVLKKNNVSAALGMAQEAVREINNNIEGMKLTGFGDS